MSAFLRVRALVVVLAIGAALMVAGTYAAGRQVADQEPAVQVEPIRSAVLLCPEPNGKADAGVRVTAAVVPGLSGQDGPGQASIRTLPGPNAADAPITVPGGQAAIGAFGEARPPIVAIATGSLAPGFVADQITRDPSGRGRGLASTACAPAAADFWFVGGGAIAGRQTRVVLVNPDEVAAVVDLVIHGPDGIADAPGGRGLVVPPRERLVVRLDTLVPGVKATALHVIARSGRVGAAVDDDQMSGLASVGSDWIPAAAQPARTLYVPGVLPGGGARVLSIVAPTEDANVRIRVIAADGTFAPFDRADVRIEAGSIATLDMAPVIGGVAATLELTSDVPITAGLRAFFGGAREQGETAYTAARTPTNSPSAVSGLPVRSRTTVRLLLTAPQEAGSVEVTVLPFTGGTQAATALAPTTVAIPAGSLKNVRIATPTGATWFTLVVRPVEGSGPVLVAHQVKETSRFGDLVTGYPWTPLRTEVTVPTAASDIGLTIR